jgi:hypothetical protein
MGPPSHSIGDCPIYIRSGSQQFKSVNASRNHCIDRCPFSFQSAPSSAPLPFSTIPQSVGTSTVFGCLFWEEAAPWLRCTNVLDNASPIIVHAGGSTQLLMSECIFEGSAGSTLFSFASAAKRPPKSAGGGLSQSSACGHRVSVLSLSNRCCFLPSFQIRGKCRESRRQSLFLPQERCQLAMDLPLFRLIIP